MSVTPHPMNTSSECKENPPIRILFVHEGKEYPIEMRGEITFVWWDDEYIRGWNWYWWEEGNGSCQCNRSLYIKRNGYPDFPEMECGDSIEMRDYEVIE